MTQTQEIHHCINCERSENQIPLVKMRYAGQLGWICSQCLPTLIHNPAQMAEKLAGAEQFPSTPL